MARWRPRRRHRRQSHRPWFWFSVQLPPISSFCVPPFALREHAARSLPPLGGPHYAGSLAFRPRHSDVARGCQKQIAPTEPVNFVEEFRRSWCVERPTSWRALLPPDMRRRPPFDLHYTCCPNDTESCAQVRDRTRCDILPSTLQECAPQLDFVGRLAAIRLLSRPSPCVKPIRRISSAYMCRYRMFTL